MGRSRYDWFIALGWRNQKGMESLMDQSRSQKVQRTSEILKKKKKSKQKSISVSIDGPPENSTDLSSGPGPGHSPMISVGGPPRHSYEHTGSQRLALWRCDELCERRALDVGDYERKPTDLYSPSDRGTGEVAAWPAGVHLLAMPPSAVR